MRANPPQDMRPLPPPSYGQLLAAAYQLGRADGLDAGRLALPEDPDTLGCRFRGRDPTQFAQWLWRARPGSPPAGLAVNAGHWYTQGFRDGIAASRPRRSVGSVPADAAAAAER